MKMKLCCLLLLFFSIISLMTMRVQAQGCCCPKVEVEADYLLVWRQGREIPPLITTSPAGVFPGITNPETEILFGSGKTGNSPQSGVQGALAYWFCDQMALRAGGLWVSDETIKSSIKSDDQGVPSIGIPFFSLLSDVETATTVALEGEFAGNAKASTTNKIWGADVAVQWKLVDCYTYRLNFLAGYQYYNVRDNVDLEANSDFLQLPNVANIDNRFSANNVFNGGLVGFIFDYFRNCWDFRFSAGVGLGEMKSTVKIEGQGVITPPTGQFIGFVQDSNRGTFHKSFFAAIPEVGAKLCYFFNDCLCLAVGYQLVYWSDLYLAGKQIDRRLNSFVPTEFPKFLDKKSSFWLQGLSIGIHAAF